MRSRGRGNRERSWRSDAFESRLCGLARWRARALRSSSDLLEIAVPAEAVLEAGCSGHSVLNQGFAPIVPFRNQPGAHRKAMTRDGRAPVSAHTHLRKARDLACQLFRLRTRPALGGEIFAQPDLQALLRGHFAPRENNLQCAALSDDPRQPHRAAVNQRHAPTPAIDAEVGFICHDAKVAPQSELHAAGNGRPLDGRDYGLSQFEARRAQRSARNLGAIPPRSGNRNVELAKRIIGMKRADIIEVPTRAKRAAGTVENRNAGLLIRIKFEKSGRERICAFRVHGITGLRAVVNDRPYRCVFLNPYRPREPLVVKPISHAAAE